MEVIERFFHPPDKSYFLFGPRGTGKSTWAKHYYPEAPVIDLLDPEAYRSYSAYPERLKEFVWAQKQKTIVIDEIQKVPDLLPVVHLLIETHQGWQFILTGSSARKLKREGVDLLAGRALFKEMHPFMASELNQGFSIEKSVQMGMLPLVHTSQDPFSDLHTYIALYIKEEVQMESLVRHIEQFARLAEVISFSQGCVLNYENIARDCYVSSKTVESYVKILEDLLLCFTVPVFRKKAKRHLTAKPKFYYFDAGVYHAIRPKGPMDEPAQIEGHALETLVAQHLRAWLSYSQKEAELYFWRTKSGLEVDFVIYGEIGFYAVEIKHSRTIKPQDLRGLREFQKDYPQSQCILLYNGQDQLKKGAILCLNVEDFLRRIVPNKPLPSAID